MLGCAVGAHRITPACAGKSHPHGLSVCLPWDHPRVCGEKMVRRSDSRLSQGSPPRMRGKEDHIMSKKKRNGITPACAGKSPAVLQWPRVLWDHPRMCGEKSSAASSPATPSGSPPHVRGKVCHLDGDGLIVGITPACAGKRRTAAKSRGRCEDHPRMCGEKRHLAAVQKARIGSPPHVRGKD